MEGFAYVVPEYVVRNIALINARVLVALQVRQRFGGHAFMGRDICQHRKTVSQYFVYAQRNPFCLLSKEYPTHRNS